MSPLTPDHVNPERPWPHIDELAAKTGEAGFELRERLTIYPEFIERGEPWLDPRLLPHVRALACADTGLADEDARPAGLPWQEPDEGFTATGRTDLHRTIDTTGRTSDRRDDFDDVYGDWEALREQAAPGMVPQRIDGDVRAALATAADDPTKLTDDEALALLHADGPALDALCRVADDIRKTVNGDDVTYIVTRNINFTNVCYTGCRFCAFAQRRTDADAYTLSLSQVADRAEQAWDVGAVEVCMQGGIHPDLPGTAYFDIAKAVKERVPGMHVHAFSPMEVVNGATRTGMSIRDWLTAAKEAGLDSIPGTAAEILDDEVRWVLTKGKLPTATWIEVIKTAHELGIRSSSTMMYGHVDQPRHWLGHFRTLAGIQRDALSKNVGGFTEFVTLPFIHTNAPVYLAGIARPGPTTRDNRAVTAMARVLLHPYIPNIQTSWVKLGTEGAAEMLRSGANDLGGTLMEETISRMAGSSYGSYRSIKDLVTIAEEAGSGEAAHDAVRRGPAGAAARGDGLGRPPAGTAAGPGGLSGITREGVGEPMGSPTPVRQCPMRSCPNWAFFSGTWTAAAPNDVMPLVVSPPVAPRSTQAAPESLYVPSSRGAVAVRSALPSPFRSDRRTFWPKPSPVSEAPGTAVVDWLKACEPVPDRPPRPPLSRTTLPASLMLPMASPGTPTAMSA